MASSQPAQSEQVLSLRVLQSFGSCFLCISPVLVGRLEASTATKGTNCLGCWLSFTLHLTRSSGYLRFVAVGSSCKSQSTFAPCVTSVCHFAVACIHGGRSCASKLFQGSSRIKRTQDPKHKTLRLASGLPLLERLRPQRYCRSRCGRQHAGRLCPSDPVQR